MAYKIYFDIPERELGNVDIIVTVYKDTTKRTSVARKKRTKGKLGELHLSKGGVDWYPRGVSKNIISKSWRELANLIDP